VRVCVDPNHNFAASGSNAIQNSCITTSLWGELLLLYSQTNEMLSPLFAKHILAAAARGACKILRRSLSMSRRCGPEGVRAREKSSNSLAAPGCGGEG
jgi:hypothetical protein